MSEFQDKGVIVTGAAGIYGRWIAAAFAREGARLCLSDNRRDALERTAADLGLDPAHTLLHTTELREESSILDLANTVRDSWGAPDILVNNAGIYPGGDLFDLPTDEWDRMFDINVRAVFILSREAARLMVGKGIKGSIVNISSGASRKMNPGRVAYCASKTTLERLTKGLALDFAPRGIRVNAVEPGFAPGSEVSPLTDEYVANMLTRIPLGRSSGPEDASGAVLYLCSEKASYVTGAVLTVDGGNSIRT
ncbi:SDR family NAD(P)-dependent oxidoreductase [Roseomonas sp. BN140053]|uniref:SDR family NAD(P)-dependent oxidoreductase n=1 Tax=Roseomonas sp. BN140053 TaxID=3391898 RepID=UPI0039EBAB1B